MSFISPIWLLTLLLVPLALLAQYASRRRRRRYALRFPAVATLIQAAGGGPPAWRRIVPLTLLLLSIAALGVAMARPQSTYYEPINQASFVLVTDHSGSMAATDVQPTRLAAAQKAANTFIDRLPSKTKVGVVAFSSAPDAAQVPSTDHDAARSIINSQSADGATATGDALALALQLLKGSAKHHPPAAIVLLSDGSANSGQPVSQVAQEAKQEKIPIYTVALGTPDGVLTGIDPNGLPQSTPVPPDPALMQQIATVSGGRAFNAQTADELSSIYSTLGRQLGSVPRKRELTYVFAAGGLVLLVGAAAGSVKWSGSLP